MLWQLRSMQLLEGQGSSRCVTVKLLGLAVTKGFKGLLSIVSGCAASTSIGDTSHRLMLSLYMGMSGGVGLH